MSKLLTQKADLALSDLTAGGKLNVEQTNTFIRKLIDSPTMLRMVRSVPMNSPQMEINKIGFGSRILKPGKQTVTTDWTDRLLTMAERSKPTTEKVTLTTKEVMAEVRIPYEVLEDNIERGNMEDTILALIAERAALDLEELLIKGDTSSSDTYLALMNGVLKLVTSNVVDAANAQPDVNIWNLAKKTLPTKYRRNLSQVRYFVSMDTESDYRVKVAGRATQLGDAVLTGLAELPVLGSPMTGVALMPTDKAVYTNPQNIIFGIQRNISIEADREIRSREVVIVLTARIAVQLEEEEAAVKIINLG